VDGAVLGKHPRQRRGGHKLNQAIVAGGGQDLREGGREGQRHMRASKDNWSSRGSSKQKVAPGGCGSWAGPEGGRGSGGHYQVEAQATSEAAR